MNKWTREWFAANAANNGGVVRRNRKDVEKYSDGLVVVIDEARKRKWHVIETGEQIVLLCHEGELAIHC
jgi:phage baseplate assembly protein gpV